MQFSDKKVAVYTAIYGDKDEITELLPQNIEADYFLYTDDIRLKGKEVKGWKVIYSPVNEFKTPRMKAKTWKIKPSIGVLKDYDFTVWIDGHITFKRRDSLRYLLGKGKHFRAFKHPEFDCIFREFFNITNKHRWVNNMDRKLAIRQLNRYNKDGFPKHHGLVAGSVLIRDNSEEIKRFNEFWWLQIMGGSQRDQLSLPYSLYKMEIKPDIMKLNNRDNRYINYGNHK